MLKYRHHMYFPTALTLAVLALVVALPLPSFADTTAEPAPAGTLSGALSVPVSSQFASGGLMNPQTSGVQAGEGSGADTLKTPADYYNKWPGPFWMSVFDIIAINEVIWMYNRYIREGGENPEFRKGWNSFTNNLKSGFEWDDNNFSTNHFLHPYHGSLYFTGARSNGFSYWESIPFAFAGSWWWEYFGEVNHPAYNDWINTAMGGIALGEVLIRLGDMVYDNTDTGASRTWREIGGFFLAPARGFNRMLHGDAFEVHANPPDRIPNTLEGSVDLGVRTIGDDEFWNENYTKVFLRFKARYGHVFKDTDGSFKPFDVFDFLFMINFDNKGHTIQRINSTGMLYGHDVKKTERTEHVMAAVQHFDYYDNNAYTFGAQSVSASYFSRYETENGFQTTIGMNANGVVLGASTSDYPNISGRDYDYGPGLGFKVSAGFGFDDHMIFGLAHEQFAIYSISGNKATHHITLSGLYADVPLRGFLGLKFEYLLYLRESIYQDYPNVSERSPEIRVYFSSNVD